MNDQLRKKMRKKIRLENNESSTIKEAYVTQAKKFDLKTELLSDVVKEEHQKIFEKYVESLNTVSIEIDTAADVETSAHSEYRNLKLDEVYNLNAAFLHALYFENISDGNSSIAMDTLAFMRLERDFGGFDRWQLDFINCAMASRSGWAVCAYNSFLRRYINIVVDSHDTGIPFSTYPIIVLDMHEHAYFKDYSNDKKSYIFAMLKELNWLTVEDRIKKTEKISKI